MQRQSHGSGHEYLARCQLQAHGTTNTSAASAASALGMVKPEGILPLIFSTSQKIAIGGRAWKVLRTILLMDSTSLDEQTVHLVHAISVSLSKKEGI